MKGCLLCMSLYVFVFLLCSSCVPLVFLLCSLCFRAAASVRSTGRCRTKAVEQIEISWTGGWREDRRWDEPRWDTKTNWTWTAHCSTFSRRTMNETCRFLWGGAHVNTSSSFTPSRVEFATRSVTACGRRIELTNWYFFGCFADFSKTMPRIQYACQFCCVVLRWDVLLAVALQFSSTQRTQGEEVPTWNLQVPALSLHRRKEATWKSAAPRHREVESLCLWRVCDFDSESGECCLRDGCSVAETRRSTEQFRGVPRTVRKGPCREWGAWRSD